LDGRDEDDSVSVGLWEWLAKPKEGDWSRFGSPAAFARSLLGGGRGQKDVSFGEIKKKNSGPSKSSSLRRMRDYYYSIPVGEQ
jgi:hypothetical protein